MKKIKGGKKSSDKAEKTEKKETMGPGRKAKEYPIAKSWKEDKESGGFRTGSWLWCGYMVWTTLKKGKPFTEDDLARKLKVFCSETKLTFKPKRVFAVVLSLRQRGLVRKVGAESYEKTVNYNGKKGAA